MVLWHNLYKLGYFNARKIVAQIPKSESEMSTSAPRYLQHDTTACVCISYKFNVNMPGKEKRDEQSPPPSLSLISAFLYA